MDFLVIGHIHYTYCHTAAHRKYLAKTAAHRAVHGQGKRIRFGMSFRLFTRKKTAVIKPGQKQLMDY
jgi:hypothetical protein